MELSSLVQEEQAPDRKALNELLRRRSDLAGSGETVWLEYKEGFDASTRAWAELLKDLVAFHNGSGGLIIVGVSDAGELVGLPESLSRTLDSADVTNKLGKYAPNARLNVAYFEWSYHNKRYGALRVSPGHTIVVFDKPGNYPAANGGQKSAFQEGVVYVRTAGKCAPAKQTDVDRLLRSSVEYEMSRRLAQIEMVASLPSNTQLMARNPESPGAAYVLQTKDTGMPVRIVGEDEDTEAVPLAEVLDTEAPYSSLQSEVAQQVRFWRAHPDHRAAAATLHDWYLRSDDLELDSDAAEFCFLSAVKNHAFPLIWAAALSVSRLKKVLDREIKQPWYPLNAVVPYVIATFFWDRMADMLHDWEPHLAGHGPGVADRIRGLSREQFLMRGRFNVRTFVDPTDQERRLDMQDLLASRSLTDEVFTAIVRQERDSESRTGMKQLGYQCDILLAAPDGPRPGT